MRLPKAAEGRDVALKKGMTAGGLSYLVLLPDGYPAKLAGLIPVRGRKMLSAAVVEKSIRDLASKTRAHEPKEVAVLPFADSMEADAWERYRVMLEDNVGRLGSENVTIYEPAIEIPGFNGLVAAGSAVVVIEKDGKLLAISRGDDITDWSLPGGLCEPGESLAECASRELLEETGIRIAPENLKHVATNRAAVFVPKDPEAIEWPDELKSDPFEGHVAWMPPEILCSAKTYGRVFMKTWRMLGRKPRRLPKGVIPDRVNMILTQQASMYAQPRSYEVIPDPRGCTESEILVMQQIVHPKETMLSELGAEIIADEIVEDGLIYSD